MIAGKYRLESVLGKGGMGVVYAARHLQLQQQVAIKFLLPEFAQDRAWLERFLREAQVAFSIRSEHVVRVLDVSVLDAAPYLVMEYLVGASVKDVIRQRGPLPVSEAVGYVLEACEALAEAHARGFVHRDIKPSNLFLAEQPSGAPVLKVLDFGIAKGVSPAPRSPDEHVTGTGELLGSPYYMAPEQLRNRTGIDARTREGAMITPWN